MKNICTIFASPHKNGTSAAMLEELYRCLGTTGTDRFDVFDMSIRPCIDCGWCKSHEGCAFNDMDGLYDAIEACDLLIIAFPIYNRSVPAPLKCVMDRFQRYFNARFSLGRRPPIKKSRKAILLCSAGSKEETGEFAAAQFERCFSVMNTRLVGFVTVNDTDRQSYTGSADIERIASNLLRD